MAAIDYIRHEASGLYVATGSAGNITKRNLLRATGMDSWQFTHALRTRYGRMREEIKNEYGLIPPWTEFLRADVTGYELPFLKEREVWKKFSPSYYDWMRRVKLPLEIMPDVAAMLGIYRSGFTLDISGNKHELEKQPSPANAEFYGSYVVPRIKEMHNLEVYYNPRDASKDRIVISSKAVVTWLMDDLGFPDMPYFLSLPNDARRPFMEGFLAGSGFRIKGQLKVMLTEDDFAYIADIRKLAESLGLHPQISEKNRTIYFHVSDLEKVTLLNPRHQR